MPFAAIVETVKKSFGYGVEQKSIGLTDTTAFELFGAVPTYSGTTINSTSALTVPAVLQATRLISEAVGSLPCKLYRNTATSKEDAKDHPAYKLVHARANDWTSAGHLRVQLTVDALLHGAGYAQVVRPAPVGTV